MYSNAIRERVLGARVPNLPDGAMKFTHFGILEKDEVASGYSFGWEIEAPVIEMHLYMPWLERRFIEHGGEMIARHVQQISRFAWCSM